MIVIDIETSGLTDDCGIWQIGALQLENPKNYFLQEGRIDKEDNIQENSLKVTGKTKKELRNQKKRLQRKLIKNYLGWVEKQKEKIFLGQNVTWDIHMIEAKTIRYDFNEKFPVPEALRK